MDGIIQSDEMCWYLYVLHGKTDVKGGKSRVAFLYQCGIFREIYHTRHARDARNFT